MSRKLSPRRLAPCLAVLALLSGPATTHAAPPSTTTKPATAITLAENTVQSDFLLATDEQRWFQVQPSTGGKLTLRMEAPQDSAVNYNLYLYKLASNGNTLNLVAFSARAALANDQLSVVLPSGSYYALVQSEQGGSPTLPFKISYRKSASYDAAEPDDSPSQAKPINTTGALNKINQTSDNDWDEDWLQIDLPSDKVIRTMVARNDNAAIPYVAKRVEVYNSLLEKTSELNLQTTFQYTAFSKGTSYLRIFSDLPSAGAGYSLRIAEQVAPTATSATVSGIATDGGVAGYVNYGQGSKWRVKNQITVTGTALGSNGQPISGAPVVVEIKPKLSASAVTATVLTGSNGEFSIPLTLGPAIGQLMFDNGVSRHYYDVITIKLTSNNGPISSNVSELYHFAYQMLNP